MSGFVTGEVDSDDDDTASDIAGMLNQPTRQDRNMRSLYDAQDEAENSVHEELWVEIQKIKENRYPIGEMKNVIDCSVPDLVERWGNIEYGRHYGAPENTRRGAPPAKRRGKAILDNLDEFRKKIEEIEEWDDYMGSDDEEYKKYHGTYKNIFKVKGTPAKHFTMEKEGDPGQWLKLETEKKTWDSDLRKDVELLKEFRERDWKKEHDKNMKEGWTIAVVRGKKKKNKKANPDYKIYYHKELQIRGCRTVYLDGKIRYCTNEEVESAIYSAKKDAEEKAKKEEKPAAKRGDGSGSGSSRVSTSVSKPESLASHLAQIKKLPSGKKKRRECQRVQPPAPQSKPSSSKPLYPPRYEKDPNVIKLISYGFSWRESSKQGKYVIGRKGTPFPGVYAHDKKGVEKYVNNYEKYQKELAAKPKKGGRRRRRTRKKKKVRRRTRKKRKRRTRKKRRRKKRRRTRK